MWLKISAKKAKPYINSSLPECTERGPCFSIKKPNFLSKLHQTLQNLTSWKPANFCVVQKNFMLRTHFLTKFFQYALIQSSRSDKLTTFTQVDKISFKGVGRVFDVNACGCWKQWVTNHNDERCFLLHQRNKSTRFFPALQVLRPSAHKLPLSFFLLKSCLAKELFTICNMSVAFLVSGTGSQNKNSSLNCIDVHVSNIYQKLGTLRVICGFIQMHTEWKWCSFPPLLVSEIRILAECQ